MSFFLFKQKTAYEMRISDWSSDVCSSDLPAGPVEIAQGRRQARDHRRRRLRGLAGRRGDREARALCRPGVRSADPAPPARADPRPPRDRHAAGRPQLPRDREVRPPARTARRGPEGLSPAPGGLLEVLLVLVWSLTHR